jgi:hypothetical protein
MISLNELGYYKDMNLEHYNNLLKLSFKINLLREAYGKPLRVTSGYRSKEKHLAIYAAKGITDQKKIPMQSRHLSGLAVDLVPVKEPVSDLHKFIKSNVALMQEIGLWFEDFSKTPTWLHAQCVPPKSGKLFFMP